MTGQPDEPRVQRQRLGAELRRLRTLAGLSGREVGRRAGISHPNVSRIENGSKVPSLPEVTAWAEAVGLSGEDLARLTRMTEAALNEVTTYRDRLRAGLPAMQQDVRELEATTRVLRNFSPVVIPGLLQTASYARHVFEKSFLEPRDDVDEAVAGRLGRQSIIADPSRHFEWITTEMALRWRPAGIEPGAIAEQYDRIQVVAGLANVTLGVIPDGVPMTTVPWCGFVLYDVRDPGYEPFVIIENSHAAVYVNDPEDVDFYRAHFERIREAALSGADAIAFVREIAEGARP
jgi:transcriptional regulator with XRE-family HTH domain